MIRKIKIDGVAMDGTARLGKDPRVRKGPSRRLLGQVMDGLPRGHQHIGASCPLLPQVGQSHPSHGPAMDGSRHGVVRNQARDPSLKVASHVMRNIPIQHHHGWHLK